MVIWLKLKWHQSAVISKLYTKIHKFNKSPFKYEALSGWGSGKVFLDIIIKKQDN